jgi:signal transduction histidine kinase
MVVGAKVSKAKDGRRDVQHEETKSAEHGPFSGGSKKTEWLAWGWWGIGIDPQYQQQIFGMFQRLHERDTCPGTGIGLAIVAKGVERMGGRVGIDSTPGKGSRFWFELPKVGH